MALKERNARNAYHREWRAKNKDRLNAEARTRAATTYDLTERRAAYEKYKSRQKEWRKERYTENLPQERFKARESKWRAQGIRVEDARRVLLAHDGRCDLCGSADPKRKSGFVLDHCHKTGKIRGVLCHGCNIGLGHLGDDATSLERALTYLKRS